MPRVKQSLALLLILMASAASAQSMQDIFQEGMAVGHQAQQQIQSKTDQYPMDKNGNLPGIKSDASQYEQSNYYQGEAQSSTQNLDNDAAKAMTEGDAQVITESILTRPDYAIDLDSPEMQHSTAIASQAEAIINGTYPDCHNQQECHPAYEQKSCTSSALPESSTCQEHLVVEAKIMPGNKRKLSIRFQEPNPLWWGMMGTIHLKTGESSWVSPIFGPTKMSKVEFSELVPSLPCDQVVLEDQSIQNNWPGHTFNMTVTQAPSCSNGFVLGLSISAMSGIDATISYELATPTPPDITEHWEGDCQRQDIWEQAGVCHPVESVCTQGPGTQKINDVDVYEECWQRKVKYSCPEAVANTCGPLQEKHCEQTGSDCALMQGGICVASNKTYQCATTECKPTDNIACGDGQAFCVDGASCGDDSYTPNQDFDKSVAALNAITEADASYTKDLSVFNGNHLQCREVFIGALNCCADKGWAKDIGLASCTQEEKQLGAAKEQKRVVELGRYCSQHIPLTGICTEHKKSYCVFGSQLAMEVQKQGRQGQLHIPFGGPQNANCRGMTPDEFSDLNFELINLDFMYDDIQKNMKQVDQGALDDEIAKKVHDAKEQA